MRDVKCEIRRKLCILQRAEKIGDARKGRAGFLGIGSAFNGKRLTKRFEGGYEPQI